MKFPVVISLRKAFPIWAIPKESFFRVACCTRRKLVKMDWHVSGRR